MSNGRRSDNKSWRQRAQMMFLSGDAARTPNENAELARKARELLKRNNATFRDLFIPVSDSNLLSEYRDDAEAAHLLENYKKLLDAKVQELTRSIEALLNEEADLVREHDGEQLIGFELQKELFAYQKLAPPLSPTLKRVNQTTDRRRPEISPAGAAETRSFRPVTPSPQFAQALALFERLDHESEPTATRAFAELLTHAKAQGVRLQDIFLPREDNEITSQAILERKLSSLRNQVEILERETSSLEDSIRSLIAYEGDLLSEVLELRPLVASLRTQNADIKEEVEAERKKRGLRGPPASQAVPQPQTQSVLRPQPGSPGPSQTASHQPVPQPQAQSVPRPQPASPGPPHTVAQRPSTLPQPLPANQPSAVQPRGRTARRILVAASIAGAIGMFFYSKREAPPTQERPVVQVLVRYVQRDVVPITEPHNNAPPAGRAIQKGMRVLVSPEVEKAWRRYFDAAGRSMGYIDERDLSQTLPPEPDLNEQTTHVLYAKEAISLGPITIGGKQFQRLALPGDPLLVQRITSQNGVKMAHIAYSWNNREYGTVLLARLTAYPFTGKTGDALARAWTTSCAEFNGYHGPWTGANVIERHKRDTRVLLAEQFIDAFQERWTMLSELKSGKYTAYIRNAELGCPVNDPLPVRTRNQRFGRAGSTLISQL